MPDTLLEANDSIRSQLEAARRELLDLGLRNPLLNYRLLRARGVVVVDERSVEIFRLLVREGRRMTFQHREEEEGELLIQPEEEVADGEIAAHHLDTKLQTPHTSSKLQSRLLSTYYAARSCIEEQGINTLYLTLGHLVWYEAASSNEPRRAPLLLIPVALERSGVRDRFHLRYDGEEIGPNLSLEAKLKADFGITLPQFPDVEDLDVDGYFDQVETAIKGQERWSIERNAIALGLFSFAKLLMFRDLDDAAWPEGMKPSEASLLCRLLGNDGSESAFSLTEEDHLDHRLGPRDIYQVVDADSSQLLALSAVGEGRNLVIQGPPGTGKSQTITNLVADAIGKGKRVLFIAEKMAALEVVKRRLDAVGLGEACLELHSQKSNKKALLDELKKTLNLGRPVCREIEDELLLLGVERQRLNDYCEAVNSPIRKSGVTPCLAYGRLLRLMSERDGGSLPVLDLPGMADWTAGEYAQRRAMVVDLQVRLGAAGSLADHPFRGSRLRILLASDRERLANSCAAARTTTEGLIRSVRDLALSLGLEPPAGRAGAMLLCRAARCAIEAPALSGTNLGAEEWRSRREELLELLDAGAMMARLHEQYDDMLLPDAWTQNLLEVRAPILSYGDKWWRFLIGDYRRAKKHLAIYCRKALPKSGREQLQLVDAVLEMQRQRSIYEARANLGARLYGAKWQGERSNWAELKMLADWVSDLHQAIESGELPAGLITFLATAPRPEGLREKVAEVESALARYEEQARSLIRAFDLDEESRFGRGRGLEDLPFEEGERIFGQWETKISELYSLVAYNHQADICRENGLGAVVDAIEAGLASESRLVDALERRWYESLLDCAQRERPALAGFEGESHWQSVERFRELDQLVIRNNRAQLARAHWKRLPRYEAGGQLGILRREFEKRARHLPIRQLMARAGRAVQAIKPVFMMSPLSIAAFLPPGAIEFDLVVFDEASQVKPVDAFGAIMRGRQFVVVGDSRQMPPTSFFDKLIEASEEDEEESGTRDMESILGLCLARGIPERMLRWHYRSRHESLIAVSNYEFYDNRLLIFPSCERASGAFGLRYHRLPEAVYDSGKSRTNPIEAQAVARAVMDHARAQLQRPPEERETLLVATFSMAQMEAVSNQIELLRRQNPSFEEFFREGVLEPFDVKNLENVQGDERDVIFISVGYGRTSNGTVSMNFGPLNREGGERRLNVLITRARRRCEIFTNLTADDIDLNRTNARGVRALKTFLRYAEHGRMDLPLPSGREADSPFEEEVRRALEREGYQVEAQVGSAGFFIDLAVIDPERPGRYLLGIECDGASYHSSRTARDRDRLRQQVLEGLGWRIHRIWSTDWFRRPDRELRRAVEAIERARSENHGAATSSSPAATEMRVERIEESEVKRVEESENVTEPLPAPQPEVRAYEIAQLRLQPLAVELHEVTPGIMADWIAEVVRVESPVHLSEVARRIATAYGVSRVGNRISASLENACRVAERKGLLRRRGEFLWHPEMERPLVRDRRHLPPAARKMELIAPEEICAAIEQIVARSYGIERAPLADEVGRLFGFQRVTEAMRGTIERCIDQTIDEGRIIVEGSHLVSSTPPSA